MNKTDRKYIAFLLVLTIFAILLKLAEPKQIDWSEGYSAAEKKPFGTFILYELIHDLFGMDNISRSEKPVFELKTDENTAPANYIFINSVFSPDRFEIAKLKNSAKSGSYIFISAWDFGEPMLDSLGLKIEKTTPFFNIKTASLDSLTQKTINFTNPNLRKDNGWLFPVRLTDTYFSEIDSADTIILGEDFLHNANFIRIAEGDGAFFIHTSPFLFTNYYLRDTTKYDYAFTALSYLPERRTYWDEYYKISRIANRSPMQYFISNRDLKRAWFLGIFGILLFLIFKGRREQRMIPIIEPVKNSSIEFAHTIGNLYLNSGTHKELLDKKYRFLLEYIRTRLNIETHTLNEAVMTMISNKSGVSSAEITGLFDEIHTLNTKTKITESELKRAARLIDQFYTKCKR